MLSLLHLQGNGLLYILISNSSLSGNYRNHSFKFQNSQVYGKETAGGVKFISSIALVFVSKSKNQLGIHREFKSPRN